MKYIHGWLATKKRRWRDGAANNPQCLLCQQEEDNLHFFRCTNQLTVEIRSREFRTLKDKLSSITDSTVVEAMLAGVRSITWKDSAEIYSREFVCSQKLKEAMDEQLQIGWSHFLQGRISSKWKEVGPNKSYKKGGDEWSNTVVSYCITVGL